MSENCLGELQNLYGGLKGAEKRVGDYLLRNPREVIHQSITEMAQRCESSEATIVRLCKKLGCKGFQDMKIKIAGEFISPLDDIFEDVRADDEVFIMMRKVFQSAIFSLRKTLEQAHAPSMQTAIDLVAKSEHVALFGMGGSAAVAMDACHKFMRTGKRCEFQQDTHMQAMLSSIYTEKDCIIAVSNTGSNREQIQNIEIARENHVPVIAVTSNSPSPLSSVSDVVLQSFGREQSLKSEAMSSRLSALSLLDCLYVGVCLKNPDEYHRSVEKIRNAISLKRY